MKMATWIYALLDDSKDGSIVNNVSRAIVAAVIPGAKTPAEATENARLLNSEVPQVVWDEYKRDGLLDPNAPTSD